MKYPSQPANSLRQRSPCGRRCGCGELAGVVGHCPAAALSCLLSPSPAMTETREPAETGGYASLEDDEEDLSPGPEHSSDSEYTLSEPDSEEEEDEEEEEEETTDDPEYDPGYKVKQRLGGGRGGPSRRAPRAAQPPGPAAQPCQLCGRPPLGEAPPGTPPCRLCCPATAPQEAPAPEGRVLGEEEEEPPRAGERAREGRPAGPREEEDEEEEEDEDEDEEGSYQCTECEDSFDNLGELHGHFMLHARGEV
ncbi:zinc finger protein 428 isoform X3 [Echinops telfairi]|nr:zinc finger protein 428 isoform X3 [Echinops telfairi]